MAVQRRRLATYLLLVTLVVVAGPDESMVEFGRLAQ